MSRSAVHRVLVLVTSLAVLGAACGSSDDTDDATTTDAGGVADVDFEVFSSDEGAGCAVYVSVPEEAVSADTDLRGLIWTGVVTTDAADCGFSDVVEVGLITVDGLDEYNQPDWSSAIEHGFFAVDGWDRLVDECSATPIDDACADLLQTSLTE